jgi:hypothetical protein
MAKPFVVPKQPIQQHPEPEGIESEVFELSGDVKKDLETALRAVAFLLDFVDSVGGAEGLRTCADEIGRSEVQR